MRLTMTAAEWLARSEEILQEQPLTQEVGLTTWPKLETIVEMPNFRPTKLAGKEVFIMAGAGGAPQGNELVSQLLEHEWPGLKFSLPTLEGVDPCD